MQIGIAPDTSDETREALLSVIQDEQLLRADERATGNILSGLPDDDDEEEEEDEEQELDDDD